jgi:hypothetical protein
VARTNETNDVVTQMRKIQSNSDKVEKQSDWNKKTNKKKEKKQKPKKKYNKHIIFETRNHDK